MRHKKYFFSQLMLWSLSIWTTAVQSMWGTIWKQVVQNSKARLLVGPSHQCFIAPILRSLALASYYLSGPIQLASYYGNWIYWELSSQSQLYSPVLLISKKKKTSVRFTGLKKKCPFLRQPSYYRTYFPRDPNCTFPFMYLGMFLKVLFQAFSCACI